MPTTAQLPHILAAINLATIGALLAGHVFVRAGNHARHRVAMVTALSLGIVFLAVYATYHLDAGLAKFGGDGIVRPIYFAILILHILLSALAAVLVPVTAVRALAGRREPHRNLARTTWSVWLLVATSGLAVYVMTIHVWPSKALQAQTITARN